jgi:hypothetical protein
LGTAVTNQNCIHEEIKSRLDSRNVCYHSVQNLLCSRLRCNSLKTEIYKTAILSVVLYGRETRSLAVRKKVRLRVSENRVLRGLFGPEREEVTGGWRRLHTEELHNLYASRSFIRVVKSRKMRWEGHVARTGEMRITYGILVENLERKRPFVRCRRRWEDNIRLNLREIGR